MKQIRKVMNKVSKGERGQALVEFGLVAIVFFAILFGVLDMARLFQAWNSVQHSAREGARYAITLNQNCSFDDYTGSSRSDCITATSKEATTGLNGGGVNSSIVQVSTQAWDYPTYADPGTANQRGNYCDIIEVTVRYRFHFVTPILDGLFPSGVSLVGNQRMTNEPHADDCIADDGVTGP